MNPDLPTGYRRYRRYFVDIGRFYRQKKVRVYTEIILTFLTVSFFLFFAIKPTAVTITGLLRTINDQRLVAEKLENKISTLSQAETQYLEIEPSLNLVEEALPDYPDFSLLSRQIEALAIRSQVMIKSLQFTDIPLEKMSAKEEKSETSFNLAAIGSFDNLKNFLNSFSQLRRMVLVNSFVFKSQKTDTENLNLNLSAKAYWLPKEQVIINKNHE